jgi:hypothetical protein
MLESAEHLTDIEAYGDMANQQTERGNAIAG